jgi:hypothetical protein
MIDGMSDVFYERGKEVILVIRLKENDSSALIRICQTTTEKFAEDIAFNLNTVLRNAALDKKIQGRERNYEAH